MVAMVSWPTVTDDDGTLTVGTPWAKAVSDAIKASVEDQVHSATNPTLKPYQTTDEVKTARGSLGSLDARIDVAHNDDGTHKSQAGLVTVAQAAASNMKNLGHDTSLVLWPDGDASPPSGFTKTGAGSVIARCGSGMGDGTQLLYSKRCLKFTYGSAVARLTKTILSASHYNQGFDAQRITIAVRCKASVANLASVVIDDGATQTRGGSNGNNSFHVGDGTDKWIYCTHFVGASATKLEFYLEVAQAGSAYFGAWMVVIGEIVPTVYSPERWGELYMGIQIRGNLAVGSHQNDWTGRLPRDCFFMGMAGVAKTAPTGTSVTLVTDKSINFVDWLQMYNTFPDIDVTEFEIDDGIRTAPDGTYARRCFKAGDFIKFRIAQIGAGAPGADLCVDFLFHVPMPELDAFKV